MFSYSYFEIFTYLFKIEFKNSAKRFYLGSLWWFIEPLLYVCAFYFVFSYLREREENYIYFLMTGIVVWRWMASSIVLSSRSVLRGKNLISSFNVSLVLFPAVDIAVGCSKFLLTFSLLIIFLIYTDNLVSFKPGEFLLVFLTSLMLVAGLSLLMSFLCPFVPDVQVLLSNMMMFLMFLSGVILPLDSLPMDEYPLLSLNPFLHVVQGYRYVTIGVGDFPYEQLMVIFLISFLVLVLAIVLLNSVRGVLTKRSVL